MTVEQSDTFGGWPWQFFELAGAILLALRPDGTVSYINQKGAETLGYPVQEILDSDWFETFLPARMRADVRRVFEQVSAGAANAPERFENTVLCRDGSERIIAWRNSAVRDASGKIVVGLSSGEDVTEQRRAEAALREGEARFRATFEQAAVGMAHVGLDWRFLRLNEKLCEITGYSREELEARTFGDITHPDDLAADVALAEALRAGTIPHYAIEKRYIRKDGSTVWVKLTGSLVRDCQGRPDYFIAVVDDITLRKQAERLLADEELQRMALSSADAGAWQWDKAGSLSWKEKTYRIFGLDPSEAPPDFRSWLERCVHREDRHLFEDALRRAADEGGAEFRIEFRSNHPQLGQRWVISVGRVICDDNRRPARAYGIVMDITEKRRIEERLHASEERLRMAMAAGDIGVWDWDIRSGGIGWSENFAAVTGIAPEDFPTTVEGWRALVHPDDRERVDSALHRALAGEEDYAIEFRMLGPEGRVRWTASRGRVIRDEAGQPIRMIGIDMDVSARKAADERQELVTHELDHRIRNLITLVQSMARQTLGAGPDRDEFVARTGALGKAHALLLAGGGGVAEVAEVVSQVMAPYSRDRIRMNGPRVSVPPRMVQMLALILHELATNAAKHGALAGWKGTVSVDWSTGANAEDVLHLSWTERDVSTAGPLRESGFGTRLLRSVCRAAGGQIDLSLQPDGLSARLRIPLSERPGTASTGIGVRVTTTTG